MAQANIYTHKANESEQLKWNCIQAMDITLFTYANKQYNALKLALTDLSSCWHYGVIHLQGLGKLDYLKLLLLEAQFFEFPPASSPRSEFPSFFVM